MQTLLKSQELGLLADIPPPDGGPLESLIKQGYDADPFPSEVLGMLARREKTCNRITLGEYED